MNISKFSFLALLVLAGCGTEQAPEEATSFAYKTPRLVEASYDNPLPFELNERMQINGQQFGRSGSTWRMIDSGDRAISIGCHEFGQLSNSVWTCRLGATMVLLKDGQPFTDWYHDIRPTEYGYDADLGAAYFRLNHDGDVTLSAD